MTRDELRNAIADAVEAGRSSPLDCADAALAVVRRRPACACGGGPR